MMIDCHSDQVDETWLAAMYGSTICGGGRAQLCERGDLVQIATKYIIGDVEVSLPQFYQSMKSIFGRLTHLSSTALSQPISSCTLRSTA